jgi:hypothetical protein
LAILGLEFRATPWATPPAPLFCDGFFLDRVSPTICPGWLQTPILLISASWVVRIIRMSHWHPGCFCFWDRVSLTWPLLACLQTPQIAGITGMCHIPDPPSPPECWDYRCSPYCPTQYIFWRTNLLITWKQRI